MDDREQMVEFVISQQLTDPETYKSVKEGSPMLARMMLEKFKNFLLDSYFTSFERQTVLLKFFEEQDDMSVIKEILDCIQNSDMKDDYTKIIMEWTYNNSENIISSNLAKFDGAKFNEKKLPKKVKLDKSSNADMILNKIIEISLLPPPNDDGGLCE